MNIEVKKLEVELMRVEAAKSGMELQIMERKSEIDRLQKNIEVQEKRVKELKKLIKEQGVENV